MRICSIPLALQNNVSYHLDLKKYPKSIFKDYVIFWGLGMILIMKINSINQKNYIRMFTTSILKSLKKKPNTCKNISPTQKYVNFIFQSVTNFRSNSNTCK
jgi:hypothetical protein